MAEETKPTHVINTAEAAPATGKRLLQEAAAAQGHKSGTAQSIRSTTPQGVAPETVSLQQAIQAAQQISAEQSSQASSPKQE